MANPTLLVLRLEAPLQSWGLRSIWYEKDTASEPTKSGIVGLIGCAFGYGRLDPRLKALSDQICIGVRVDRQGRQLRDYHTINHEYLRSDGSIETKTGILTNRYYLEDASFLVVIGGPASLLHAIKDALEHPKWLIYLGRKACVPSRPILDGVTVAHASIRDALERVPWTYRTKRELRTKPERLRCVLESDDGTISQHDAVQGTPMRTYGLRRFNEFTIPMPALNGGAT